MRSTLALVILAAMFSLIFMFGAMPAAEQQMRLHNEIRNSVVSVQR
jgi:hypothetical protein